MFAFNGQDQHCIVTSDNRLRVWKGTANHQQLVEKDHLKATCTSVAWIKTQSQGKRKSVGDVAESSIAMGMENGSITVWNLHRGVVSFNLGKGMQLPAVTDVAFSPSTRTLFSSSLDKEIIEWDLETGDIKRRIKGDKNGTTKLCAPSSSNPAILAAGSLCVRLIDLTTGKRGVKLPGSLADNVTLMEFSNDGKFLASAASGGRFINVYDCAGEGSLVRTLSLAHSPTALSLSSSSASKEKAHTVSLAACCDSGRVAFFRFDDDAGEDAEVTEHTLNVSADAGRSALGVTFHETRPATHVCVAHGSLLAHVVDVVSYASSGGKVVVADTLGGDGQEAAVGPGTLAAAADQSGGSAEHHVLGPSEVGLASRELDADVASGGSDNKRRKAAAEEAGGAAAAGEAATIAQRLDALSSALAASSSESSGKQRQTVPTTESLATLLEQALQSSDDQLLEDCLAVSDPQVVEATVDRLPPTRVLPFLMRLSDKVERRPSRATSLCVWMRAILLRHASFLMSVPNLHVKLTGLYNILEGRTTAFPKLLSLNGRLELALSQISSQQETQDLALPHTTYDEEIDERSDLNDDDEDDDDDDEEDDDEEDDDEGA